MTTQRRVLMAAFLAVSLLVRRVEADSYCSPNYGGSGAWYCSWVNSEMSCTDWFLYCDGACAAELSGWGCDPVQHSGYCSCS